MELAVYQLNGSKSSKSVELNDSVFGVLETEKQIDHVIYLDVKQYLANQRQGTHKSKQRAEVNYSTKKIVKQKGSGGARHGSIKAPIFVGGGRAFGPVPRDYSFKLNKKVKHLARNGALAYKAKEEAIKVVETFNLETIKTKGFLQILSQLALSDKKILVVLAETNSHVYLSARNIKKVKVVCATDLNTYDIINAKTLLVEEEAIGVINELFSIS